MTFLLFVYAQSLACEVRDPEDLPLNRALTVNVSVGFFTSDAGSIRVSTSKMLSPVVVNFLTALSVLIILSVAVLIFVVCCWAIKKRKHQTKFAVEFAHTSNGVAVGNVPKSSYIGY